MPGMTVEAESVGAIPRWMKSWDGIGRIVEVVALVGVDVEEATVRSDVDVSVVSEGPDCGGELLRRGFILSGLGAT